MVVVCGYVVFLLALIVCVLSAMYVIDVLCLFFFFKQKTAYEMRISDWSSDVCSSDLAPRPARHPRPRTALVRRKRRRPAPSPPPPPRRGAAGSNSRSPPRARGGGYGRGGESGGARAPRARPRRHCAFSRFPMAYSKLGRGACGEEGVAAVRLTGGARQ